MDSDITFTSDGLTLAGSLHVPDTRAPDQKLPAVIVLHGFIGAKDNSYSEVVSRLMESWGYVVLRIDFRGCGKSEGQRGYVLCHDQVADTRNAMTWLAQRPEVDPARIAVLGHSFGAAIAAYTASTDTRFAAAVISCGWGNRGHVRAVATSKAPTGPYRGVGRPISTFVMERLIDLAAQRLVSGKARPSRSTTISARISRFTWWQMPVPGGTTRSLRKAPSAQRRKP